MTGLDWRKDSRAVTFEYNQRGHQVYRVIEIDAGDRRRRAPSIDEQTPTFFEYSAKKYRYDLADGQEIDLDVGARRVEPPLPLRRRDRAR